VRKFQYADNGLTATTGDDPNDPDLAPVNVDNYMYGSQSFGPATVGTNQMDLGQAAAQITPSMNYDNGPAMPATEEYLKTAQQAAKQTNPPHPSWWRTLAADAALVAARRHPQFGEAVANQLTSRDPQVERYGALQNKLALEKQAADVERAGVQAKALDAYRLNGLALRQSNADANARAKASADQARTDTEQKGQRSQGFEPLQNMPAPGPAPMAPAASALPDLNGPGAQTAGQMSAPAVTPAQPMTAMPSGAPAAGAGGPQPTNRLATATPATLAGTKMQGQIPLKSDLAKTEVITPQMADFLAKQSATAGVQPDVSQTAGQHVTQAEWNQIQQDMRQSASLAAKPPKVNTPEQQFIDEYQDKNKGASVSDAIAAYSKLTKEPKDQGENFVTPDNRMIRVSPGGTIPAGAVRASTAGPTVQMRNVAAQASLVHTETPHMLSEIDRLQTKLGPMAGRWNDFMQGKVGMSDPDFAGLRGDLLMYSSAVALMHARGRLPENLRAEFDHAINNPTQDFANLKAIIKVVDNWTTKNMEAMGGTTSGGGDNTTPPPPPAGGNVVKWGRDANGNPVRLP
jgi:hypothetical protein